MSCYDPGFGRILATRKKPERAESVPRGVCTSGISALPITPLGITIVWRTVACRSRLFDKEGGGPANGQQRDSIQEKTSALCCGGHSRYVRGGGGGLRTPGPGAGDAGRRG